MDNNGISWWRLRTRSSKYYVGSLCIKALLGFESNSVLIHFRFSILSSMKNGPNSSL